jgi:plastocyanin
MFKSLILKPSSVGLGMSVILAMTLAGCGGQATDSSDAIVIPDTTAVTSPPPTTAAAPADTPAPTAASPSPSAAPVVAEGWGTLKGQVTFQGDPPAAKPLIEKGQAPKDPEVCAKDTPIFSERLVVDPASKGVKFVLVYLARPTRVNDEAKQAISTANLVFDQENCVFDPHVMGMMAGVPVTLKSSDPVNHNVNAKLRQSAFNQLLAGGQSVSFTPSGPERTPGEVTCDIHPWMKAWWMVLDHPYFAVTDDQGYFEIKNVPAGTQKVVVWQEAVDRGFVTAPSGEDVEIKANDTTVKDFTIAAAKLRAE